MRNQLACLHFQWACSIHIVKELYFSSAGLPAPQTVATVTAAYRKQRQGGSFSFLFSPDTHPASVVCLVSALQHTKQQKPPSSRLCPACSLLCHLYLSA